MDDADEALAEVLRAARLVWPTVALPADVFAAHLARHLPAEEQTAGALQRLHTADLYLAAACARGDDAAIAAFEARCMGAVDDALARQRLDFDAVAEVKQRLRERVLVADQAPARIAGFSGRGSLRAWLFVLATREAVTIARRASRDVSIDSEVALHAFVTSGDGELEQLELRYRAAFAEAFDAALRALPARDQTLLRQHVLDGLSIDRLAALYNVHRSTAARGLERARQAVLAATRARLRAQLGVASRELDSILRQIRSRLEVSLRGLLRRRAR